MKECSQCKENKPLDAFHRDNRRPDGRNCSCKGCRNRGTRLPDCYDCRAVLACQASVLAGGPMLMGCENGLRPNPTGQPPRVLIDNSHITLLDSGASHRTPGGINAGRLLVPYSRME